MEKKYRENYITQKQNQELISVAQKLLKFLRSSILTTKQKYYNKSLIIIHN